MAIQVQVAAYTVFAIVLLRYVAVNVTGYFAYKVPRGKITTIAKRDLTYLGYYNERLRISIMYWVYSMQVYAYRQNRDVDLFEVAERWCLRKTHDPEHYIRGGIEDARNKFLAAITKAKEEKTEPRFKVSYEYDYHDYPKRMRHSDYYDPDILLDMIDKTLGGVSVG